MSLSYIFEYDCIFNVPESYDVENQVMHKSTIEVLLVSNEMNPRRKATIQTVVIHGGIAAYTCNGLGNLIHTHFLG